MKITKSQIKQIIQEELDNLKQRQLLLKEIDVEGFEDIDLPSVGDVRDRVMKKRAGSTQQSKDKLTARAVKARTKFEKVFWLMKSGSMEARQHFSKAGPYGPLGANIDHRAATPKEALERLNLERIKEIALNNSDTRIGKYAHALLRDLTPGVNLKEVKQKRK